MRPENGEATRIVRRGWPGRVFYGWWIVATGVVATFMNAGFCFYALSAFFEPLNKELGWGRALVSGAISISYLISGVASPLIGRWTDRYGPKALMLIGASFTGIALMFVSLVSAVWQLYAAFVIAAIGRSGTTGVPTSALVANWFAKRRGTAMGLTTTGIGLGGVITAPLAGYLIGAIGWRWTLVVFGLIVWTILLPLVALVVKARPQDIGLWPDGEPPAVSENGTPGNAPKARQAPVSGQWTLSLAMQTPSFWLIALAYAFVAYPISAVVLHAVPFFVDRGISTAEATTILGSLAALGIVGKLTCGYLADRIPARATLVFAILLQILGLLILLNTNSIAMAWVYVLIFGYGMGAVIALTPLVIANTYGLASYGSISGVTSLFYSIGWSVGPVAAGLIYDATSSYSVALAIDLLLYAASAAALFLARPATIPRAGTTAPSQPFAEI